jgi:hypothetical protein
VVGYRSDADYAFVTVEPGRPVALYRVRPSRPGQPLVTAEPSCVGAPPDGTELPDGSLDPLGLTVRGGTLEVRSARRLLRCALPSLGRGAVGVAALTGTVAFDDLAVSR